MANLSFKKNGYGGYYIITPDGDRVDIDKSVDRKGEWTGGGSYYEKLSHAKADILQRIKSGEGFNVGGMALKKQMELFEPVEGAFNEGGLMDEGGTVDPESGNDVPVGSTQEEVRDDIPAQLSEGEFVLPADVVRYHGLEKIMALRDEAKAGLARMEAMGQMGNSEEATIPDGIPFDINDLDMVDDGMVEFQTGGFVQQPTSFIQQPTFAGIQGYQPSQFTTTTGIQGVQPAQFNAVPTGYIPYTTPTIGQPVAQTYTPPQQQAVPMLGEQTPGSFTDFMGGIAEPSPGGYDELKTYVNDAGQEMQIPFKDGNPIYPIPDGFKLKGEAVDTAKTTTTQTTASASQQDSSDEPSDPFQGRQTVRLGGTVVTKDMVDPLTGVLREGLNTYRAGTVKGSQEYVLGTASSKTRPTGGSGSIITDMIAGAKDTVKGILSPDQITLTNKGTGVTVAMTKDLYQEIIADKFGADREKMLSDIFTVQAGLDAKKDYNKDVDNRMAENLAKKFGIEYKGQSVAQLTAVDIPAATNKAVEKEELEAAQKAAEKAENIQKARDSVAKRQAELEAARKRAEKAKTAAEAQRAAEEQAAAERAAVEAVQNAYFAQIGSDESGDQYTAESYAEEVGTIGPDDFTTSTGYGIGAKGGLFTKDKVSLHKQMKQSGLASKK